MLWVASISLACFVAWIADQILRSFFEVISLNKQQYIYIYAEFIIDNDLEIDQAKRFG